MASKKLKYSTSGSRPSHKRRKSSAVENVYHGKYVSSNNVSKNGPTKHESKKKAKLSSSINKYGSTGNSASMIWHRSISPKGPMNHLLGAKSSSKHPFFRSSKHSTGTGVANKQHSMNEKSLKNMTKGHIQKSKSPSFFHKKSTSYFQPEFDQSLNNGVYNKRTTSNYFYKNKVKNKSYLVASQSKNGFSTSSFIKKR